MFISFLLLFSAAQAESLPPNFFKNSGIRSTQFVRRIDLCARTKTGRQVFLINQWEGSNQPPPPVEIKEGKKKKKKVRSKRKSPELKSQTEIEAAVAQLIKDKEIDVLVMENCNAPMAVKFKEKVQLSCETEVSNRFDFLISSIKKADSSKPVLLLYEEQHSDEIMKKIEAEKWNCEVYEPKAFKVKKVKRKPHTTEVLMDDEHDDDEEESFCTGIDFKYQCCSSCRSAEG